MAVVQTGWSADGNWFWDGARWNDALSEDGKWRFDGASWQAYSGQRTQMPAQPPAAPTTEPPAPPIPVAPVPAAAAMPSWVDPSEIQRMESQRIEAQIAQMTPAEPLPPDRDWRLVGERMQYGDYTHNRGTYAGWRVGVTSVIIYLFLLWFCGVFSVIYVWLTGWRSSTKMILTGVSVLWVVAAIAVFFSRYSPPTAG